MENVMLDLMLSAYQGANMGLKFCGNSYGGHSYSQLGRESTDKETGWIDTYCPLGAWVELRCVIRH